MTHQPELDHEVIKAAEKGDQLAIMQAVRGVLARSIAAGPSDRDMSSLVIKLIQVNEQINTLEERKRNESGDKCPHCNGTGIRTIRDHSGSTTAKGTGLEGV